MILRTMVALLLVVAPASAEVVRIEVKARADVGSLRTVAEVREVEASFRRGADRGDFRLVAYSLQDDHLHAIVEANGASALGRGMTSLATRFARAVNRALRRRGGVLRERYHLRVLRSPTQVRNALRYVLLYSRRHWAKQLGRRALPAPGRIDPASSGRWFDGWRSGSVGAREAAQATDPPAVRPPRTWMLRAGWRRLGLLDPADVPG